MDFGKIKIGEKFFFAQNEKKERATLRKIMTDERREIPSNHWLYANLYILMGNCFKPKK